jgi:transposase
VDGGWLVNGVLWRTRTGAPWRDLPVSYGNWKTVYSRHRRWSGDGRWEAILEGLRAGCDGDHSGEWAVGVDSTVVRAHQHAAGARHEPPKDVPPARLAPLLEPDPVSEPPEVPPPPVVGDPVDDTGGWVEPHESSDRAHARVGGSP